MRYSPAAIILLSFLQASPQSAKQGSDPSPQGNLSAQLQWRLVGPANMGGRITDLEIVGPRFTTWYAASASGGLFKTVNAGTTWEALFQKQSTISIGDVAVAPSNPDVVWVGTGEENARNSVSWGDGVYKSIDGGKTFESMGLRETFQIGHIAIHPEDADIVYVAALGKLWGHNPERGVYHSKNGGETWEKIFYLDDKTGCIDLRLDPENPSIIYAAMYERMRDGFDSNDPAVRFGEKSGLYRSLDAGTNWQRLTTGLPTTRWGRSGLDLHPDGSLFAVIETERSGWATGSKRLKRGKTRGSAYMGLTGIDGDGGAEITTVTTGGPSDAAGIAKGDLITKLGDQEIHSYKDLTTAIRKRNADEEIMLTYRRGAQSETIAFTFGKRRGGKQSDKGRFSGRLGGQNANIQDQQGEDGFETGGLFRSDDHGDSWRRLNSLTERPFYFSVIAVDPSNEDNIYACGVPLYASTDGGESFETVKSGIHSDFHAIWIDPRNSDHLLVGSDGGIYETYDRTKSWKAHDNFVIGQFYHANVDDSHPYKIYGGLQDNGTWAGPSSTRYAGGSTHDDWVTIYRGDGFRARIDPENSNLIYATSQNGGIGRVDMRRGGGGNRISKPDDTSYNWDTPFFLSPHNAKILYFAGNKACRSIDRGRHSQAISAKLGLSDRGTATSFAESHLVQGLLYVGTDDGALWRSEDSGQTWSELHANIPDLPGPRYVSHIEPSLHVEDRVYLTLDGHRSDDFAAYIYVSEDRGESWTSLSTDLPKAPIHVIRECPSETREALLFIGTEFGCFLSHDRGEQWMRLGTGLPHVAVRDLVIQPRERDLIAATHGRGLWIVDIAALSQIDAKIASSNTHLFQPNTVTLWQTSRRGILGHDTWQAPNPPAGAAIYLYLKAIPEAAPVVTIHDVSGKQINKVTGKLVAGIQRLQWDARFAADKTKQTRRSRFRNRGGPPAPPGNYSVRIEIGEETFIQPLLLIADPLSGVSPLPAIDLGKPHMRPSRREN